MSKELIEKLRAAAEYRNNPVGDLFKEAADALEAKAAPAGEREALERELLSVLDFSDSNLRRVVDHLLEVGYSRAAWQRTQAAGVPDGERLAELLESVRLGDDEAKPHGSGATYWNNAVLACQVAIRDALAAAPAQPAAQEQHPDDEAVDRFSAAMKAKLAKSREKGRHGWQTASAAHLSGLLYRHMYKADPLDVANLAMMLHQNGQAIELPQEARHDQGEAQMLREALERATKLLSAAAGYATKMEPMPAKLLNAIDAELDASTGQEE